jgi:hypothetical protein
MTRPLFGSSSLRMSIGTRKGDAQTSHDGGCGRGQDNLDETVEPRAL